MKTPPSTRIILTLILVATLLTMPAMARVVANGGTIFDYEHDLDLTTIAVNGDILAQYLDDDPCKGQIFSIPIPNMANVDLTAIDLAGHYGTYFVVSNTFNKVYIREPSVSLDVVLEYDRTSSIDGAKVSPWTSIAFQMDAPEVGTYLPTATVKIEITKPNGAKTVLIPAANGTYQSLSNIPLNAPRTYLGNLDISRLEAGTYTAQAKWQSPYGFADYAAYSNTVNFTIGTYPLGIASNKERLVRGGPFVVTLNGEPKSNYFLYVRDASTFSAGYPAIKAGQPGVSLISEEFPAVLDPMATAIANIERARSGTYVPGTAAIVSTNSEGIRTIEFCTSVSTDDRTFTIKVIDPCDGSKFKDLDVSIEGGGITLSAEGTGTYLPGEEIALSGTNTDSDIVYLFMTGPNLDRNGVPLNDLSATAANGSYLQVRVAADDTWEYCWDTGMYGSALLPGTYTLYAASTSMDWYGNPISRENIWDAKYDSTSILIQNPSVSVWSSAACIAAGDEVTLEGVATGSPETVLLWISGPGGSIETCTLPVDLNGTFIQTFGRDSTAAMSPGQHYAIVQHPMSDGIYAVRPDPANIPGGDFRIINATGAFLNLSGMTAPDAAFTVLEAIKNPNSGDICAGTGFAVQTPSILIDQIEDADVGDVVNISGTTNLAAGDCMIVNVLSSSVNASKILEIAGVDDEKHWFCEVDTSGFGPGGYEVLVSGVEVEISASSSFVIRGAPTPTLFLTPSTGRAFLSSTGDYAVVLSIAPEGLSGYNLTVSLDDASLGEIIDVSFPSWSGISLNGPLPADTVWIKSVDLNNQIVSGAVNVTLCTLTIRGDATGETGITLTPEMVDADFGGRYAPDRINGMFEVITVIPFEKADGSLYPPPTGPTGDGLFEDLDGNGWIGFNDVVIYFNGMDYIENNQPIDAFDYDGSGFIGFNDVVRLFERI